MKSFVGHPAVALCAFAILLAGCSRGPSRSGSMPLDREAGFPEAGAGDFAAGGDDRQSSALPPSEGARVAYPNAAPVVQRRVAAVTAAIARGDGRAAREAFLQLAGSDILSSGGSASDPEGEAIVVSEADWQAVSGTYSGIAGTAPRLAAELVKGALPPEVTGALRESLISQVPAMTPDAIAEVLDADPELEGSVGTELIASLGPESGYRRLLEVRDSLTTAPAALLQYELASGWQWKGQHVWDAAASQTAAIVAKVGAEQ